MSSGTTIKILAAGLGLGGFWLAGNWVYFHTLRFWEVPTSHQMHWLLTITIAAVVIGQALTIRGSVQDRTQHIVRATCILFGAYALAILLGRQFFSRSILISIIPATLILAMLVVWVRNRGRGIKAAVVGPLVQAIPTELAGAPILENPETDFRQFDVILVDLHEPVSGEWARALSRALLCGCRVRHINDYVEEMVGAVSIDQFELDHMVATEMSSYIQVKRFIDLVISLLLVPIVLPVVLVGALAVLLASGWPVFFIQDRTGLGGQPFKMWKLRTMRQPKAGDDHRAATPGDPRITKIGRLLRRTRIDELPQLWNVLKGDMSLIGPRPEAVQFHNAYTEVYPKFAYRCLVRPGMSGWAQVNAPPSANADEAALKLQFDLYYVKWQSAALDLQIAIRTIWAVTKGAGVR